MLRECSSLKGGLFIRGKRLTWLLVNWNQHVQVHLHECINIMQRYPKTDLFLAHPAVWAA